MPEKPVTPKKITFAKEDYYKMLDNIFTIPGQQPPMRPGAVAGTQLRQALDGRLKRIPRFPTLKG